MFVSEVKRCLVYSPWLVNDLTHSNHIKRSMIYSVTKHNYLGTIPCQQGVSKHLTSLDYHQSGSIHPLHLHYPALPMMQSLLSSPQLSWLQPSVPHPVNVASPSLASSPTTTKYHNIHQCKAATRTHTFCILFRSANVLLFVRNSFDVLK